MALQGSVSFTHLLLLIEHEHSEREGGGVHEHSEREGNMNIQIERGGNFNSQRKRGT